MLALLLYFQWKPVYEDVDKVQADPAVQACTSCYEMAADRGVCSQTARHAHA